MLVSYFSNLCLGCIVHRVLSWGSFSRLGPEEANINKTFETENCYKKKRIVLKVENK